MILSVVLNAGMPCMVHAYGIQLSAGLFDYGALDSSMLPWPQLACDALHVYHPVLPRTRLISCTVLLQHVMPQTILLATEWPLHRP
jgi:hypothetical protein